MKSTRFVKKALGIAFVLSVLAFVLSTLAGCAPGISAAPPQQQPSTPAQVSSEPAVEPAAPESTPEPPPAVAGAANCAYQKSADGVKEVQPPAEANVSATGSGEATLYLNDKPVKIALNREATPCTVNSFESLAKQGFYDGTSCHRLVDGPGLFVLQCGDPSGTGSGGPGYSYADELSGAETYQAGVLAMANAGPNTNGSQFFIVYEDSQLPPSYTVFGTVDSKGLKVIKDIAAGGQGGEYGDSGVPKKPATITKVTVK